MWAYRGIFFFFIEFPAYAGRCLLCSPEAVSHDHDGPAYYETTALADFSIHNRPIVLLCEICEICEI